MDVDEADALCDFLAEVVGDGPRSAPVTLSDVRSRLGKVQIVANKSAEIRKIAGALTIEFGIWLDADSDSDRQITRAIFREELYQAIERLRKALHDAARARSIRRL